MPAAALAIAGAGLSVLLAAVILLFLLFILFAPVIPMAAVRPAPADPSGVSTASTTTLILSIVFPFPPLSTLAAMTVSLLAAFGGGNRCHGDRSQRPSDQALEGVAAIWSRRQPRDEGVKLGFIHAANIPSSRSAAADAEKTITDNHCTLAS
jgi:hypothetical protein